LYRVGALRKFVLRLALRTEGGQIFSLTLRDILEKYHKVAVDDYSYGSLLVPGQSDAHLAIGKYVSIGPGVRRIGASHPLSAPSLHPFWYNPALGYASVDDDVDRTGLQIEHDSWIGANVTILPGCKRVGIGAVIGAGSVVTKNVGDFEVWAGNPAKPIGDRLSTSARDALLGSKWWELDPSSAAVLLRDLKVSWE
jgi:acetyltransferase-like isoleucine patch superfamily enzyme